MAKQQEYLQCSQRNNQILPPTTPPPPVELAITMFLATNRRLSPNPPPAITPYAVLRISGCKTLPFLMLEAGG
jgi:hypothetical protein